MESRNKSATEANFVLTTKPSLHKAYFLMHLTAFADHRNVLPIYGRPGRENKPIALHYCFAATLVHLLHAVWLQTQRSSALKYLKQYENNQGLVKIYRRINKPDTAKANISSAIPAHISFHTKQPGIKRK
jgi:hypothetical protein